jgi:hypothetical protein
MSQKYLYCVTGEAEAVVSKIQKTITTKTNLQYLAIKLPPFNFNIVSTGVLAFPFFKIYILKTKKSHYSFI